MESSKATYARPGFFTKHVFNRAISLASRLGISMAGSRELVVTGRRSGRPRATPVNLLELGGETYLVAPRGTTEWVRNLRAAGEGELRLGRRSKRFTAEEVADEARTPILRAYLDRWAWEAGAFFDLPKEPTDEQIAAVAPLHPVFRVIPAGADPPG